MNSVSKTVDEVLVLGFEFARELETVWRPGEEYATTDPDYVRPTVPNGFEYECTNTGQSGFDEPVWPLTVDSTVDDGSVEWTARAFGANATDTISARTVTAQAGLTVDSSSIDGTKVVVTVSGGTLSKDYELSCKITTAGGETIEAIALVSVRRPTQC